MHIQCPKYQNFGYCRYDRIGRVKDTGRIAGKYDNIFTRFLSAPGTLMQRITTKEPTDDIIEVGIAALKAVLPDDVEDNN